MIDRLKKLLQSESYTKMTSLEISSFLGLQGQEHAILIKAINQLEEEGLIYISKNGYIHLSSKVNVYLGEIKNVRKYYAICKVHKDYEDIEVEIPNDKLNNAYVKDIVRVMLTSNTTGQVLEIINRNMWEVVCEYKHKEFICDDKFFPYEIKVIKNKSIKLVEGHLVLLKIKKYEGQTIICEVKKIIGHKNDPGMDILSEIIKSGVRYEFSQKLLDYTNNLVNTKEFDLENRVDLTNELIVTIDGIDAKDLDDAISLKILDNGNYYLGVHIADVSYYVTEKNEIDKEAYNRGTSIYLADRVIPMLPHILSNGICSLNPNETRLTISCFMEIDYQGNVINYDIKPSYIQSKARLNYADVNALFKNLDYKYDYFKELKEMLFMMRNLSSILSNKMKKNGYLELDIDEVKLIMDDKTHKVIDIQKRVQDEAEKLIENFMILANETVASHIYYQQLPFIYRIHPTPSLEKLQGLATSLKELDVSLPVKNKIFRVKELQDILEKSKGSDNEDLIANLILRSLSKAVYSVENVGHFGLGSKVYTHFTSPIRRYPDLLVHRHLRKYEFEHNYDSNLEFLIMAAENSSMCERRAVSLERDIEDIKKAEYMSNFIGSVYDGTISGILDFGAFVKLDNTCEGLMRFETIPDFYNQNPAYALRNLKIGSKIRVEVISVNVKNGEINFAYYSKRNIINKKGGYRKHDKNHRRK